jgi:hypothetical protein
VDAQFDSQLVVYAGSCSNLECVAGNDDGPAYSDYQSALNISTLPGATYHILVHGYSLSSVGTFTLEVLDPTSTPPDDNSLGGSNDKCNTAMDVEIGAVIPGDTSGTTVEVGLEACGGASTLGAGGLWYSLLGVGNSVLVGVQAEFDAQVLVFSGRCDVLTCIDGNDDNSAGYEYQAALELDTVAGQVYYIYGR